jgi:hypothetical protein
VNPDRGKERRAGGERLPLYQRGDYSLCKIRERFSTHHIRKTGLILAKSGKLFSL